MTLSLLAMFFSKLCVHFIAVPITSHCQRIPDLCGRPNLNGLQETDKAVIDVEAAEDGILAKIIVRRISSFSPFNSMLNATVWCTGPRRRQGRGRQLPHRHPR